MERHRDAGAGRPVLVWSGPSGDWMALSGHAPAFLCNRCKSWVCAGMHVRGGQCEGGRSAGRASPEGTRSAAPAPREPQRPAGVRKPAGCPENRPGCVVVLTALNPNASVELKEKERKRDNKY